MGRRSRQRVRGEAAEALVREQLEPLAPGEVPGAIKVAASVAALIAVANLVSFAAGLEVRGEDPKPVGVIAFSALMLIAAVFMVRRSYWAVLGFQALLGISIIFSALALLVASNVEGALLATLVIVLSGTLFWFLVRAMARVQMPRDASR